MLSSLSVFCRRSLLLLSLTASTLSAEETYGLQIHWIPGKSYTQETTTETTTVLTAVGQADDVKMKVKQTTSIDVTGEPNGSKEARVTFKALSGDVLLKGKKSTFDSSDLSKADPMIKASVGQSVGKSFILVYNGADEFVSVKDTGSMAPDNLGNPVLADIAEAKEVAELYRRSLEMGLPKIKVKPGDRWTTQETIKFPSAGTVKVELRVKFEALIDYQEGPHAKLSFEGDMVSDSNAEEGRPVTLAKGSKTYGQILFDLERGTPSFAAFRADIKLDVQGRILPIRQQVTTKLVKLE